MKKIIFKRTLRLLLIIIIVGFALVFSNQTENDKNLEKIIVGFQPSPPMAILMVAKDKGFFEKYGLDAELKEFTAGKFALAAFFGGSLDFSVSGDVPPVLAALQGNQFVVPAQLVKRTKSEVRVVARKDGNLNEAKPYFTAKKRKLATSAGGGPEFFTYELLNKLGIANDQIEIINQKPEDMVAALVSSSVDAIAMFDPVAYIAEKQMGEKGITFTDESIYSELYVVVAHTSVRQNSGTLEKFLKALLEAEKFLQTNTDEAKDIVVKYTKLDRKTVDAVWDNAEFGVSLTPELFEYWNRQTEWAKNIGKISIDTQIPDLKNFIFSDPLKKLSPDSVTQ